MTGPWRQVFHRLWDLVRFAPVTCNDCRMPLLRIGELKMHAVYYCEDCNREWLL